jgi:hypothetical protein
MVRIRARSRKADPRRAGFTANPNYPHTLLVKNRATTPIGREVDFAVRDRLLVGLSRSLDPPLAVHFVGTAMERCAKEVHLLPEFWPP